MYQKITITLVFIGFSFLQLGDFHVIATASNDLKSNVELAMTREYERVALFGDLLKDIDQETYDDFTAEEKLIVDYARNIHKDLLEYYDELKKESLSKNVIPNMDNHLFEVRFLEVLQKYVNKYLDAIIKKLHNTSLKKQEIKKIEDHLKHLAEIFIDQFIKPFENEIKNHPYEWKILDLFYNLVNGQTVDKDQETPKVIKAYLRYLSITKYAIKNNKSFLRELYEDLKKHENDFRLVEDLDDYYRLLTDNELVNGNDDLENYEPGPHI